jgi:hypothetical protein
VVRDDRRAATSWRARSGVTTVVVRDDRPATTVVARDGRGAGDDHRASCGKRLHGASRMPPERLLKSRAIR